MPKRFILSAVIFINLNIKQIYCQEINPIRHIVWKSKQFLYDPEKNRDEGNNKYILSFENAIYETSDHLLPIYNEDLQLNGNFTVILENQKFEQLSAKEIDDVADLKFIKQSIEIETKLNYIKKRQVLSLKFIPLRKNELTGYYEKLISFELKLTEQNQKNKSLTHNKSYTNQSVLNSGKWIKIKINKSGIYRMTYDELRKLGISSPENVRIFGNGGKMLSYYNADKRPDDLLENNILKADNSIYFYGEGPVQWMYDKSTGLFKHSINQYSDYAYYFLSSDYSSQNDNLIETENQSTKSVTHSINTFNDYAFHEIDSVNLIRSGRLWVAEHFDFQTEYSFQFDFPNLVNGSNITAGTSLLSRSPVSSSFTIKINNQSFPSSVFNPVSYDYTAPYAVQKIEKYTSVSSGLNEIVIDVIYNKGTASSEGWLDYVEINALRKLDFTGTQMHFRNIASIGTGNVGEFSVLDADNSIKIWDITNPRKPRIVNTSQSGTTKTFNLDTDSLREFIAFNENNVLSPITSGNDVGIVENQNLHGIQNSQMIILCHPEFLEYANELKEIHQSRDNLVVHVVTTKQVYNEFSSGAPDVCAIRDFMKMLYDRSISESDLPRYLCLFGDGSYDNKHNSSENTNFILTYQSENSLSPTQSFVTDDFFGLLDDNEGGHEGLIDIGIGRLPVKTKAEAADAIKKIKNYLSAESNGDWRNKICFIADDEDNALHMGQADNLSHIIKNNYPVFNVEKIYLDAFEQESSSVGQRYPEVNLSIDNQIAKGLLLINYTGHGNENGLAEERIIVVDQIKRWNNNTKLPVFMTATCEFSRFDNFKKVSAGEHIFLNPNGGAISLFTTTRLVYASPNFTLNKNFYQYIFEKDPVTNKKYSYGEVMMLTKNSSGNTINSRNFTLLGDPAMQPAFAELLVKTNTINNKPVNIQADTLKAYQKVTITGEIQSQNGEKLSTYNGTVFPIVYDKSLEVKTLNNDGEGVFSYQIRNSQLFKGKASVKDGIFQFTFIVPKDIRYNIDTGKISYYASNNIVSNDSKGYYSNIYIGGLASNETTDSEGPKIRMYLNDENFVSGGITSPNPKLLAFLEDENGINTTGNGIGHDLTAIIDRQPNLQFNLNDYYESDIDNFTSGQIKYALPELEPGKHMIHLKAWDVYNNSKEDSLFFEVVNTEKLKISHLLNYPNPFSTNTSFFFEHNRPNELLELYIHIYTVSGKVVKTIHEEIITQGFRSDGISWDGRDDFGNKIGRGVYFYRLSIRTLNGEKAEKNEKLLILN